MLRPCIERHCPELTARTRCDRHEQAERDRERERARPRERERGRERGSPTARGLGHRYQVNRAEVLAAADGWCWVDGCMSPATTADHIVPRAQGGGSDIANLRASCPRHNYGRRP